MKPFSAWLAMEISDKPSRSIGHVSMRRDRYGLFTSRPVANLESEHVPQRVLVIADTKENRKKLGFE